jgi:hypothetical protein
MNILHSSVLSMAAVALTTIQCTCAIAQTKLTADPSALVAVSIAMQKEHVSVGESPKVILTLKNLTDYPVHNFRCPSTTVHVLGGKGEPPTTYLERAITQRWLPGEPDLSCNEMAGQDIPGQGSSTLTFEMKYFYDLSAPGKYSVHLVVPVASDGKDRFVYLRTNTVQFEVLEPVAVQK